MFVELSGITVGKFWNLYVGTLLLNNFYEIMANGLKNSIGTMKDK